MDGDREDSGRPGYLEAIRSDVYLLPTSNSCPPACDKSSEWHETCCGASVMLLALQRGLLFLDPVCVAGDFHHTDGSTPYPRCLFAQPGRSAWNMFRLLAMVR